MLEIVEGCAFFSDAAVRAALEKEPYAMAKRNASIARRESQKSGKAAEEQVKLRQESEQAVQEDTFKKRAAKINSSRFGEDAVSLVPVVGQVSPVFVSLPRGKSARVSSSLRLQSSY